MKNEGQKNDHPGYSCERAQWALVTGVGPLNCYHGRHPLRSCQPKAKRYPIIPLCKLLNKEEIMLSEPMIESISALGLIFRTDFGKN